MKKKKITIVEVNQLFFGGKWLGKVDDTAMRERLHELLASEKELLEIRTSLKAFRTFFESF